MRHIPLLILGTAALVFVAISATMNALFLSSLGRTTVETALLASVSLASDLTKLVLPVLVVRAVATRSWGQATAAALMLVVVTGMSLASGTGFAALTRAAAVAGREAEARSTDAKRRELAAIEDRLRALSGEHEMSVIEAELALKATDRLWAVSNGCATADMARRFCAEVGKLKVSLASAKARGVLMDERRKLLADLHVSGATGVHIDPQVSVLAEALGVEYRRARALLTGYVAVLLEIGSVVLVALASAIAGRGQAAANPAPAAASVQSPRPVAQVPAQADRDHWLRERTRLAKRKTMLEDTSVGGEA